MSVTETIRVAVEDRLRGAGLRVIRRSDVTAGLRAPWVIVDMQPPRLQGDTWAGHNTGRSVMDWQTTCVGVDDRQAGWVHDKVADLLTDWTPTIPGWPTVWPVAMASTPRIDDEEPLPDVRYRRATVLWSWQAGRDLTL